MEEVILPEMICLHEYGGDWDTFINEVYNVFRSDFINRKPNFRGKEMRLKHYPQHVSGWSATFYHLTHEGPDEADRAPDLYRTERLPWAHPVIENCDLWRLKIWPQVRRNRNRLCILLELDGEPDYVIVLELRSNYILPWTAFVLKYEHEKKKKLKEYREYLKSKNRTV